MNELRAERHAKMEIRVVGEFPPLSSLTHPTFLGSFAWTSKQGGYKYIKQQFAENIGAGWCTPADIARDYLAVKYGYKPLRCNRVQYDLLVKNKKHQPLYADPMSFGNASYLDLKSAYWQILQVGGWDVDYCPNRYLSPRSSMDDFPVPHIKLARNSLVAHGLPTSLNVWYPDKGFVPMKPHKSSINLVLWGFVQDVLHGIAYDMIHKVGAIYANTDGYIVPDYRLRYVNEVCDSWGVIMTVRHHGQGTVRGVGDYDIGQKTSLRIKTSPRRYEYIKPAYVDWLRDKFKFWSYRINLDLKPSDIALRDFTG